MGERLSGGNVAIALLANSLATGAILYVLIEWFAPISGAHFNPLVTVMLACAAMFLGRTSQSTQPFRRSARLQAWAWPI
jgi:glycerol uptake facilitator-like aquaporin